MLLPPFVSALRTLALQQDTRDLFAGVHRSSCTLAASDDPIVLVVLGAATDVRTAMLQIVCLPVALVVGALSNRGTIAESTLIQGRYEVDELPERGQWAKRKQVAPSRVLEEITPAKKDLKETKHGKEHERRLFPCTFLLALLLR